MNQLSTTSNSLDTTFQADLFARWIAYVDRSPKTIQTYTRAIKQFASYLATNGITSPTRADVIQYRDELKASHKPATVAAYMAAVRLFFQWTSTESIYPNIADHIKGAKLDRDYKKDPLTPKQAARLLTSVDRESIQGLRDYAILALMITTGARTIEITRADINDLRTTTHTVLFLQGKGEEDKNKYVKLSEPVEAAIRAYLAVRGPLKASAPLFASLAKRNHGGRLTTRSISRLVKSHMIAAGLSSDRWTAHSLRHTAAVTNINAGGTAEETQQLLRHRDITTTYTYIRAIERDKNNSEDRISRAIFGGGTK